MRKRIVSIILLFVLVILFGSCHGSLGNALQIMLPDEFDLRKMLNEK